MPADQVLYSAKYSDSKYEYRHISVPSDISRLVPRNHRMTETEWRNLGIQQSTGWVHFMAHNPEPHILCFRRKIMNQPPETVNESSTNSG